MVEHFRRRLQFVSDSVNKFRCLLKPFFSSAARALLRLSVLEHKVYVVVET